MTTKTKSVTFVSRSRNQLVIIVPRRPTFQRDAGGNVVSSDATEGVHAQFVNWTYTTDDPEIIKALREHPEFETPYGWKEAYDASRAKADELQTRIASLAADGNADGLRELISEEESAGDGGRVTVLRPARAALEKLSGSSGAEAAGATQTKKRPGKPKASDARRTDG